MHSRRWLSWVVILFVCTIMLIGCESIPREPSNNAGENDPVSTVPETESGDRAISQDTIDDTVYDRSLFRSAIKNLSINQENQEQSSNIVQFLAETFPDQPSSYTLHLDSVYIYVSFNGLSEDEEMEMMKRIKISGGTPSEISKNYSQYKIEITDIPESTQISFGDLPLVTLYRGEPLIFDVDYSYLKDKAALFVRAREYGSQLFVSDQEEEVVLTFPEAMLEVMPTNNESFVYEGQWLDDRHFKIPLNEKETEVSLQFPKLYSKSGNYPESWDHHIRVVRIAERTWYNYETERKVGWGATDRFFDGLIFSPDRSKYVGLVELGGSLGDGDGTSYSFILEQQDQEPQIVENVFYSMVDIMGSPIQWIDNERILYATYYGIYIYDTETGTRQAVYELTDQRTVNHVVYDSYRHQLYAMIDSGIAGDFSLDKWICDLKQPTPQKEANFTHTVLWAKYSALELRVHPLKEGVYWTLTEGDDVKTEFVTASRTYQADGFVIAVLDQGVILQDGEPYGVENREFTYSYWIPGNEPVQIPQPPEGSVSYLVRIGFLMIMIDNIIICTNRKVTNGSGCSRMSIMRLYSRKASMLCIVLNQTMGGREMSRKWVTVLISLALGLALILLISFYTFVWLSDPLEVRGWSNYNYEYKKMYVELSNTRGTKINLT